jgi:uncharacterized cupredoxin-like copper-binding protein
LNTFASKRIYALVLATILSAVGSAAIATGSHNGGHGHGKKAEGDGHMMDKQGHGETMKKHHDSMKSEGHGHGSEGHGHGSAKIDYSSVEEHEFGKASDPRHADKTVTIDMSDTLRFDPEEVHVKPGETVRFVVRNKGKLMHEMVLGTSGSLDQHAQMMMKFPGMEHDEPHMAHVAPGGEHMMGWKFTKAGEYHFGCLVPGHFQAGMKGKVIVR